MSLHTSPPLRAALLAGAGLWGGLLVGALALWPGVTGYFVFDDYANLKGLAAITASPDADSVLRYVLNGLSSTLGRPLALLSFAAQHASWPYFPSDFIRWNILLHLLNGALLFAALLALRGAARAGLAPGPSAALAIMLLWLWAPLHASAVLYIVQRMTVLAGTAVLLGLLLYLQGRRRLAAGAVRPGYALVTAAVVVGLGAGTLAKESAVLFPLLLLVLEATLLQPLPALPGWRAWRWTFLGLPLALLAGYLALQIPTFSQVMAYREYTLPERLMTEGRVLFGYLYKMLVPPAASIRILHDDVVLSKSLASPWTTAVAAVAWLGLLIAALRWRRRAAVPACAVLWFLASHALESTVVPLELAFDHRNYVALIGPVGLLVWGLGALWRWRPAQRLRPLVALGAVGYGLAVPLSTYASAALWGQPVQLARYWLDTQPGSTRAYHQYAELLLRYGMVDEAVAAYREALQRWPLDPAARLSILELGCLDPDLPAVDLDRLRESLATPQGHTVTTLNVLLRVVWLLEDGRCRRYGGAAIAGLAQAALQAPEFSAQRHNLLMINSRIAEAMGDREQALEYLHRALDTQVHLPNLRQAVIWEIEAGRVERAAALVEFAETTDRISWRQRWSYRKQLEELRQLVDQQLADRTRP